LVFDHPVTLAGTAMRLAGADGRPVRLGAATLGRGGVVVTYQRLRTTLLERGVELRSLDPEQGP
jgi:hypothetical protein